MQGARTPSLFKSKDGLFGDLGHPSQPHLDPAIRGQAGDHLRLGAIRNNCPRHRGRLAPALGAYLVGKQPLAMR